MDRDVLVYVDLHGVPCLVGRLWARTRTDKEGATFEYHPDWLDHRERFDRRDGRRIPFLSAMSMLDARDNQTRSYMEIADALRQHGATARDDIRELWRRVVFNVLISNTDDHLRNHGFLYEGPAGWRLSPAYDLNPVPVDIAPRRLTTAINEDDTTASLDVAMSIAPYFGLDAARARAEAGAIASVVATWRDDAGRCGLSGREMDRMASAFEHADLHAAAAFRR